MFHFFKKKKKSVEIVAVEEQDEKKNDSLKIGAGIAINSSVHTSAAKAQEKYSRPEYNPQTRKAYYDDPQAHKAAIDRAFSSGKPVEDPYTGAKLVKKQSDAKIQHGENWQSYAAEADHIDPLNQIAKRTKENPFLTTDDIREIGNSEDNFQVLSRKLNQSNKTSGKGGSTQQEWADDQTRMQGVAESIESGESIDKVQQRIRDRGKAAEKRNDKRALQRSVKNAASTAHEAGLAGAKDAGVTALTMSSIMNITAVIKGNKTPADAIEDTIIDGGKAAASGYLMGGGLTTTYQVLSGSSSKFLKALTESNVPGKVITGVVIIGDTLKRYGNGEITTQECLIELGEKGLNFVTTGYSMAVGQALIPIPIVGAAVGALVGSMLTSYYYNQLITTLQTKELEHQERLKIIAECEEATRQIRIFREELEVYLATYFKEYQDCFDDAMATIRTSFQIGDANGVIAGANQITRKLGGKVCYNDMTEFKAFLFDDSIDIL